MAQLSLKSATFRKEREDKWLELDRMVKRVEKKGIKSLSSDEIFRLQSLYRVTLSSLSVARNISLDRSVLEYLEALSTRAYFCIYGPQSTFWSSVIFFFSHQFPHSLRMIVKPIALSALIVVLATAVGFGLTYTEPNWFYGFVDAGLAADRGPETPVAELRAGLFETSETAIEFLEVFATYLFIHNAGIGILAFALGFAFGIPTVLLLISNGLMLGAFSALFVSKGLSVEFHGWLFIHGTTELLAIIICGGAGLAIGGAAIFPNRQSRMTSMMDQGRRSATVVVGAVAMFLIAGLLEGFGRQLIVDTSHRYIIGGVALCCWAAYFAFSRQGRR